MGKNNRQRRSERRRQNQHYRPDRSPESGPNAAGYRELEQQRALDSQLAQVVSRLIRSGWTPLDLYEVARRKVTRPAVAHLLSVVAAETARHAAALVHPRWSAQLTQLGAYPPRLVDGSAARAWADAERLSWPFAAAQLIGLLEVLRAVPSVEQVIPPPGSPQVAAATSSGIDDRVLRRVRALLAKAESTDFEDEADALTAKAQQLMTAHSIERAFIDPQRPEPERPVARRLWIDQPYLIAKATLVSAVANANHSRSVVTQHWGFVSMIGLPADLDVVELLSASLLVQATRAMTLAGPQLARSGRSRTRSFRQSFLVAYAARIGERLRQSATAAEATADSAHHGALLPVLAARDRVVDERFAEFFPQLVRKDVRVSNADGWGAGRAAADLAVFDIRSHLTATRRAG